jgi:hypothetical protein
MKIFVASAPKTGNTWLTILLSTLYDLSPVTLPFPFDAARADQMGSNWVAQQHYRPEPSLLAWAERNRALLTTPLRHPGDIWVSLWHMLQNKSYDPKADLRYLEPVLRDGAEMGKGTIEYIKKHFPNELHNMIRWMQSGRSIIVRYEDLWRDPVATLSQVTEEIQPVSGDRLEAAIDLCDIRMLRKLRDDPEGRFFRKGGPGSWRNELPESILDIFRSYEPYPEYFRALGYTLDPHDPLIDAPAKPRISTNPFLNNNRFDNGVIVPTMAIRLYLLLDPPLKARWHDTITSTSETSFYAWLKAPADEDPRREGGIPRVTNLAHYVYGRRPDLQAVFPDVFGRDRSAYATWFLRHSQGEYGFDEVFLRPMRATSRTRKAGRTVQDASERLPLRKLQAHHDSQGTSKVSSTQARRSALKQVHATAWVNSHLPVAWPVWPKGLWPKLSALAQKTIRRLLRWYINPIVEQQNRFNTAVVQALDEMQQAVSCLEQSLSDKRARSDRRDERAQEG